LPPAPTNLGAELSHLKAYVQSVEAAAERLQSAVVILLNVITAKEKALGIQEKTRPAITYPTGGTGPLHPGDAL
jgi:hypothetical protein